MTRSDKLKTFYADFEGDASHPTTRYNNAHSKLDEMVEGLGNIKIVNVSDEIIYRQVDWGDRRLEHGIRRRVIYQTLEKK